MGYEKDCRNCENEKTRKTGRTGKRDSENFIVTSLLSSWVHYPEVGLSGGCETQLNMLTVLIGAENSIPTTSDLTA